MKQAAILVFFAGLGCGAEVSSATDAAPAEDASPEVFTESAVDSAPLLGCERITRADPPAERCECDPGDTWIELDGDGAQQLMKAPYYPPFLAECAQAGPAVHGAGGCTPESLTGCVAGSSCLLLRGTSAPSAEWGHYIDRAGNCFSLVDTKLEAPITSRSGPLISGRFTATAIGAATLELHGRFVACEERRIIFCE